jgi:phospholipase/carboxylesterase
VADAPLVHQTAPPLSGAPPYPGLLLLHGRGTDETDLLSLGAELSPEFFTVSARAPYHFPWGGYAWYDLAPGGIGFPEDSTLNTSIRLVHTFVEYLLETYPIDPARLYLAGFSMGAVMAGTMALLEPESLTGAIMMSGYLALHNNLPLRPAAGFPIFQAHGTYDPVIPVQVAREARDYLQHTEVDHTYREYPMVHEVAGEELSDIRAWLATSAAGRKASLS